MMAETPNYPKVETTCHGCVHLHDEGDGVGWCNFHFQYRSISFIRECEGFTTMEEEA